MIQPEELKKTEPLTWSVGTGTDVWALFSASISGDVETVQGLLRKDPSLVRCHDQLWSGWARCIRKIGHGKPAAVPWGSLAFTTALR